jgi:hypothetical protein
MSVSRRSFLALTPVAVTVIAPSGLTAASVPDGQSSPASPKPDVMTSSFPSHAPELAREMVAVSHGNVARVRELLASRPALANASWDWGYGDWESALGAASHVGNREIAGLLLAAGARPSIFSAAMLGQLETVKAFVTASPGIQKTRGPHGITLLAHAKAGGAGAEEVLKYLQTIGDADIPYTNEALSDADRSAIAGIYAFGQGATERLTVAVNDRGPGIQREGAAARGLLHLGKRVFHPVGATAVRIRFGDGNPSGTLTIEDGPLVVTATRIASL